MSRNYIPYIPQCSIEGGQRPDYRPSMDNVLKLLEKYHNTTNKVVSGLDQESTKSFIRLIGHNAPQRCFRVIHGISTGVMKPQFRDQFNAIFQNRPHSIFLNEGSKKERMSRGTLDIYWPAREGANTKHHLIPKSRGGINNELNYYWMPRTVHDDFHAVFDTKTPLEQLAYLVLLFKPHYHPSFIREMSDLLLTYNQNHYYKTHLLRHHRIEYP